MIYLDNSATTKPDEAVIKSFQQVSEMYYGNPSSIHQLGGKVEQLYKQARQQAAELLKVREDEIIFTSGGTEANNMAIKGIALQHQERGKHIITTEIEHASVYDTCKSLKQLGFDITYLSVDEHGQINLEELENVIREDTILVSVMHVNNEMGALQPIKEIGRLLKKYPKVFFHVDGVQALGKLPIDLKDNNIDLCSFSGHKIYGLKGTGALYIKRGTSLYPLFHGGQQEYNIRSGTENVAGNVAFVKALRLILEKQKENPNHFNLLREHLVEGLKQIDGVYINTGLTYAAPHIINVSVPTIKPEVMIHTLFKHQIVLSTQSACSSKALGESRVLEAMGLSKERAVSGLRISLGYQNTLEDIDEFLYVFEKEVKQLLSIMRDI